MKLKIILFIIFFFSLLIYLSIYLFARRSTILVSPLSSTNSTAEQIRNEFKTKNLEIKDSQINGEVFKVSLNNDQVIIFSLTKDLNIQLNSLQLIIDRSRIEGRNIKQIDLRFDKPIISEVER